MDNFEGAARLDGFNKPRVWTILTPLCQQLKASNLGQGFPTWNPPQFYLDFLKDQVQTGNHQYIRSFGSLQLVKAVAKFHEKAYQPHKIDPINNIVVSNGGSEALFCCFMALLNPGDEAIFFDPAYDCYRSQIQMAGGKTVAVPLRPLKKQSKEDIKNRIKEKQIMSNQEDEWYIDFQELEAKVTNKTRVILINSPHNPVGKVFTQEELHRISLIVKKFPRIVIIEDNVYEGMIFDQLLGTRLPKIIYEPEMFERTVSVYSAGKIFAATGVRSGWAIGASKIIQAVRSVHTYNVFCYYHIIENSIAKSLIRISESNDTYMVDYPKKLEKLRNILVKQLADSDLDINFWIPKGSNFIIANISRCEVPVKYLTDDLGHPRTKDYAFALWLLYERGVSVIPCSPFYDQKNLQDRESYVRLTFCKQQSVILEAGSRMKTNHHQAQK